MGTGILVFALTGVAVHVGDKPSRTEIASAAEQNRLAEIANDRIEAVSSGGFVLLPAQRVFDSRNFAAMGLQPGNWYGVGTGIKGMRLAYVTLTVTTPGCAGFVTVDSVPGTPPNTSYLNWGTAGTIVSNSTYVPISSNGDFFVWIPRTTCPLQLVVDLQGYVQA